MYSYEITPLTTRIEDSHQKIKINKKRKKEKELNQGIKIQYPPTLINVCLIYVFSLLLHFPHSDILLSFENYSYG